MDNSTPSRPENTEAMSPPGAGAITAHIDEIALEEYLRAAVSRIGIMPPSRRLSLVRTKVQEALLWARYGDSDGPGGV